MQRTMAAAGTSRTLLNLSLSSSTKLYHTFLKLPKKPNRVLLGFNFRPLCTLPSTTSTTGPDEVKHSILLERLRLRHLKDPKKPHLTDTQTQTALKPVVRIEGEEEEERFKKSKKGKKIAGSFEELGLSEEVMGAVKEMGIEVPTEIQCIGIPAALDGKNVVLGSHTGSGKTLAYMLPLVQVCFYLHFSLIDLLVALTKILGFTYSLFFFYFWCIEFWEGLVVFLELDCGSMHIENVEI